MSVKSIMTAPLHAKSLFQFALILKTLSLSRRTLFESGFRPSPMIAKKTINQAASAADHNTISSVSGMAAPLRII
ncbi:hypothetical protein [Bradyrhizobium sp. CCBAU 45384]|uniref:hypothetical protein n=1 Tax=Bradyrhizobium sp. CCBAU 45384 TaxID=858428 RepID=UPI0023061B12|nr:hypothetical protein [Bradyrhizobium sp. CCBAU 45384]